LKFLEDRKGLIGRVYLGVALFFAGKKTYLLETLQFALNVTGIFFYEFS